MTNTIENGPRPNKFSYHSRELDLLKELRKRIDNYNKELNFHYMLKLLTQRRRFDLW